MKANTVKYGVIFAAIFMAAFLMPAFAYAQSPTYLGNVITNAASTKLSLVTVLSILSYVMGATICVLGLVRLKAWSDGQSNFTDGLWRIMGGTLLVGLPDVIQKLENSLFGANGAWSAGSSSSGGMNRTTNLSANYSNNGGWLGLDQAMVNFIMDVYQPAKAICAWAAWLLGVACMITGIYRLAQSGQAAQGKAPSGKGTAGYLLGGSLLLAAGNLMDAVSTTLFGSDFATKQFTALATNIPGADSAAVNNVVQAMFAFVEIIGWIAFLRGLFLLVKLAQGGHERSHAHAFSHIVFGAAAVNMYVMVSMIQKTLGVNLVQ